MKDELSVVRRKATLVALSIDGVVLIHAGNHNGNYATLCGLDGDDVSVGIRPEQLRSDPKITCPDCWMLFLACRKYSVNDFAVSVRRF
jgi:hypothetical protein